MKKIIDGRLYNTETATEIAKLCNVSKEKNPILETLYKKKTGEYFLYGEVGTCTYYGGLEWKCSIKTLSLEDAKRWAEEHVMDADDYMKEFGEVEE